MKNRFFILLRITLISLFMVLSLVLGACDTNGGGGDEEGGVGIREGIGESEEGESEEDED